MDESAVYGDHGHGGHTGGVFDFTEPELEQWVGRHHPAVRRAPRAQLDRRRPGRPCRWLRGAGAAPEPCTRNDSALDADDPTCTPPAEPEPCPYDSTARRRRPHLHPTRRTRALPLRQHPRPPTTPPAPHPSNPSPAPTTAPSTPTTPPAPHPPNPSPAPTTAPSTPTTPPAPHPPNPSPAPTTAPSRRRPHLHPTRRTRALPLRQHPRRRRPHLHPSGRRRDGWSAGDGAARRPRDPQRTPAQRGAHVGAPRGGRTGRRR